MPLFLVIAKDGAPQVKAKLEAEFKGSYLEFKPDTWFVETAHTTNDLADKLGIRTGDSAHGGIAVAVSSYAGRAPTDVWEWLKIHWPKAA